MDVPERIYVKINHPISSEYTEIIAFEEGDGIEYCRTDTFIEKAKKWFEKYNEWFDPNGNRHCDMESFENFRKYMEGE